MANQIKFDIGFNVNKSDLNAISIALKNIQNEINKANVTGHLTEELKMAGKAADQLQSILNQAWNSKLGQLDLTKVNNSIRTTYGSVINLKTALEGSGASGAAAYNKFASTILHTNIQLKQSNKLINDMATTLGNTFRYGISSRVVNDLVGSIQTAFNYTTKLDTSLNNIRIVTNQSADDMERFARQANSAAESMGASTLDYTNAALIYYQQGLSDAEVAARAETTIKAANVTGQTGEEVSEQLTAVWNGYKVTAEETELYVDKLAAVAATTAADLEELSTGMSKVASAANAMGVDFDDLNAQIATIVSVTRQAPESVGTALKTIYARLGDLKVDGVDEFGVSLGKVSEQMVQMGIQILDQNGDLRDMSSVIAEVAEKWSEWTQAQRQAAAVAMAGKRQYNNLIALFDNWDMYTEALNTSTEAVGTLQDQQDIYMESTAAHLQKLKTESQRTYDILFNQDTVNGFADALTNTLGIFNNFIDAVGGGGQAFTALGAIATNVFSKQIGDQLSNFIINRQAEQSNRDLELLKQQVIEAHTAKGDIVSSEAAGVEAIELQKTLEVQKGLTQEEYNELMNLQEKIGLREQERLNLQNDLEIGQDILGQENAALSVYQERLKIEQIELKQRTNLASSINQLVESSSLELITQRDKYQLMNQMRELYNAHLISAEQINTIGKLDLNTVQGKAQLEQQLQQIFDQQNLRVQEQENIIQQLIRAIEAKKQAEAGYEQQLTDEEIALRNQANTIREQAQIRQNMQAYVQALSSSVMLLQTITSTVSVLTDKTSTNEEKVKKLFSLLLFNLPMIGMNLGNITKAFAALTSQMGLFTSAEAASTAGLKAMGAAFLATPIGWVTAGIASIIAILGGLSFAINKVRENHKLETEELIKDAEATKELYDANEKLSEQFKDLKQQYDNGEISKDQLWDVTNQLIEAYDLESARISALTGDYEKFAKAIKRAREADEKETLKSQQKVYDNLGQDIAGEAAKGLNGIRSMFGRLSVDFTDPLLDFAENSKDYTKIHSIYQDIFGTDQFGIAIDSTDTTAVLQFYQNLLQYQKQLEENGYNTTEVYADLEKTINDFEKSESLQQALTYQNNIANLILESSHIDEITDSSSFNSTIENIKTELSAIIPDENEIHKRIVNYVGQFNTDLANTFIIEDSVKNKFSNETAKALSEILSGYDTQTRAGILNLTVDWENYQGDKEKIKNKIEELATYVTGTTDGTFSIPWGIQSGLDDTILKGKDINKTDWTELTNNVPNAEETLGTREEFNNKSIGERISLMHELNEVTRENASLNIDEYKDWKITAQDRHQELEKQVKDTEIYLEAESKRLQAMQTYGAGEKDIEKQKQKVEELANELQDLTSEKYEIEVNLETNLDNNVNSMLDAMTSDIITQTDMMTAAVESVGEAWIIAAEDVGNFAAIFPELMADAKWLEDGRVQLNAESTNAILQNNQDIMDSNANIVEAALEDKIIQLSAELKYETARKEALEEFLNSSVEDENAAQTAINKIQVAGKEYEETLRKENLINEAKAGEDSINIGNQTGTQWVDILKSTNDNVNALRENIAHVFDENYGDVELPGFQSAGGGITSNYQQGSYGDSESYNSLDSQMQQFVDEAKTQLENSTNRINELSKEIGYYSDALSQVKSRRSRADQATDRVQSGLAGKEDKSKSGSSSKDKKDKELKKLEDEFDRYWEINKALDLIDRNLKKIDKDQENLYGKELIRSLKQENELLDNQAQLYEQLYAAQQAEAAELRGQLSTMGVSFDASSGAITNYAQAVAQALATYNAAVTAFNNGPQDEAAQKSLEAAEKAYENFKKLIERYDTLVYNEMQDTQEKLDEIWRKQLANNLKAWEVEIQLKLDFKELEREWNDFIKEVNDDFKSVFKDLRVDLKSMLTDAKTYIGNEGTINTVIGAVHDTAAEIDKMMGGGSSDMYESVSQAQEKLKELNEELLDSATALHDLWEEAWDNYLEGIDQVADAFDDLIERFERINDELEFQEQIIELLYGDEAYALMNKLYEGQERNTFVQLQSLKTQVDMWKDLFYTSGATLDNQTSWTQDQQKYYEQWMEAQSALNDLVIDYIELLKKDYLNTVSSVLQELEKYVTGSSLDDLNTQWERISDNADKYYDSVEGAYYIQTLANKIDESIANSSNLQAQQKLMKLREKEIGYLREKENLTEYDIKAAEMRYEIALKEIALQEAQNNKTGMKLTRNEQGNWSYQYIADEDDIMSRQQELLDAYNNLYQLASNAYEANLEALTELQEKYLESAKAIYEDDTLSNEEREKKLLELREWYLEQYALLSEENQLYRNDLAASGAGLLLEIYKQDEEAYESMTDNERQLVDALIDANISDYEELDDVIKGNYDDVNDKAKETYQEIQNKAREVMADTRQDWTSGAQTIADLWNKDGGASVKTQVTKAYEQIEKANQQYQNAVDECAKAVERDFTEEGIMGAIQRAENETDNLKDKTIELVNESIPYLAALKEYVDQIEAAWRSVQQAIMDAISLIDEYLRKVGEANAAAERQAQAIAAQQAAAAQAAAQASNSGKNSTTMTNSGKTRISPTASGHWATMDENGKVTYHGSTNDSRTQITGVTTIPGTDRYSVNVSNGLTTKTVQLSGQDLVDRGYFTSSSTSNSSSTTLKSGSLSADEVRKRIFSGATGGYTGSWGDSSGKLAILHQKELVLNADDTKNFLSAVNTIRTLSSSVGGSIQDAVLKAVANTALSLGSIKANGVMGNIANNNSSTDNVFNITAEFPNANSVDDIREAILSLPNIASQYVNSTLK